MLKEIEGLYKNSSSISPDLRYVLGESETFGGNFSTHKRISFFDHSNSTGEIPCGFLKEFPISNSDRIAMENCNGVVVVSAIFNDHDKIRQPKGVGSKTLEIVCFFMFVDDATFKGLDHHQLVQPNAQDQKIGIWRIIKVDSTKLYHNPAMNGVIPKYLTHRLFPNAKFSIWIDAKLRLMVDPLLLIHSLVVKEGVDMAISKHPFYVHTMEEAMATARWKKWWDVSALTLQMETYCENGLQPWSAHKLPYTTDVPDTALILKKHGIESDLFSCLMFNELEAFTPRDQLAFAFVRDQMKPKPKLNLFELEVFEQVVVEYRHNIKKNGGESQGGTKPKRTKRANHDLVVNSSRCHNYLLQMWGERESHK